MGQCLGALASRIPPNGRDTVIARNFPDALLNPRDEFSWQHAMVKTAWPPADGPICPARIW